MACALRPPRSIELGASSRVTSCAARSRHRLASMAAPSASSFELRTISTLCSMSSCDQPRECAIRKLRKYEAQLGEEPQHLAGYCLNVVLASNNNEPRDLVADQNLIADRDRILHAVQPFGHLKIKRRGSAPANRRSDDDRIGPMYQGLVDLIHLIAGIHLGDRTGPGTGLRSLGIVTLAGAEFKVV